jgi:hypothetical protein
MYLDTIRTNASEAEIKLGVRQVIRVRQKIADANAPDQNLSKEASEEAIATTVEEVKEIITKAN